MKSAEEYAKEYYQLPKSGITAVRIKSAIKFAESYAAQDRWVKVSDRLPEKGERVLCNSIYGVQIGWLTIKGNWQFTNGGSQISITHWQPLPSLPTTPKD